VSDKRFCTACQCDKPLEGGYLKTGKIVRWICKSCHTRMSESPYARKKTNEMRHLRFPHQYY
jgi:hypothetical protein